MIRVSVDLDELVNNLSLSDLTKLKQACEARQRVLLCATKYQFTHEEECLLMTGKTNDKFAAVKSLRARLKKQDIHESILVIKSLADHAQAKLQ